MTISGADYSWARPTLTALWNAGVRVVFRYVGPPTWGKTITQAEYNALIAARFQVLLCFEQGATDFRGGAAGGEANATLALGYLPSGYTGPIYMAVDTEVSAATLPLAVQYIGGAASVLTPARTGVYGEGAVLVGCKNANVATHFWLSGSTSFPGYATGTAIATAVQGDTPVMPTVDSDVVRVADPPAPSPVQIGDTVKAVPFSTQLDADGWMAIGVDLPTTKTKTDVVGVVVDAGSPYDSGWFVATASVDWQPVQPGFCRIVVEGTAGHQVTGRVMVAV